MHTRFVTALTVGLAGAFTVVASQAFASGITAWSAFGIGLGLLVVAAVPALLGERRFFGLVLDGSAGLLAIWTIVASVVFTGGVVKWLSFAEGAAFVALSVGGLVLNQVRLARLAHVATPVNIGATPSADLELGRRESIAA